MARNWTFAVIREMGPSFGRVLSVHRSGLRARLEMDQHIIANTCHGLRAVRLPGKVDVGRMVRTSFARMA